MATNPSQVKDFGMTQGQQRVKLAVYEFYQGSDAHIENFPIAMRELVFSNDSANTLNCQVIGPGLNVTLVLLANEVIDERFAEFTSISITGTGAWRFYPRTALIP